MSKCTPNQEISPQRGVDNTFFSRIKVLRPHIFLVYLLIVLNYYTEIKHKIFRFVNIWLVSLTFAN